MSTLGFRPGSIVGRYEILEKIGEGGMAEVYLARPRSGPADARVAIKRLLPEVANERRFIQMFVAEARLAATLHHPNIAAVLDVGVDHDVPYFAMEYIDGCDVRALLLAAGMRDRPMPLALALSILYGTTVALAYVHDPRGPHASLNLVHRDISPSNILVSRDGAIKLVDFGIARIESGPVPRTASGQIKGKIPYMSPEQCRARPLDGRSDLFSLGVVLYELTANTRPFDRDSEFETLEAIVRGDYLPPSRVVPAYPADVEEIVQHLLATRPGDRYPSAGALLLDLDRVIAARGLDLSNATRAKHVDALLSGGELPPDEPARRPRPSAPPPVVAAPPAPPAPMAVSPHFAISVRSPAPAAASAPAPSPEPPPITVSVRGERLRTVPGLANLDELRELELPPLSAEARRPIDRIAERTDALLARVAPGAEDARDLPASAVAQLFGRAMRDHARGDLEAAVLALELALSAARPDDGIDALIASHDELSLAVFTAFLGDPNRMLVLSQHLEQLIGIPIDQRAAFLLTRIDGTLTAGELLASCGLPRRDACRHLCQLLLRQIVVLV